ncbi:MAG: HEAT repeat domain-containing protein [Deltaproteobacteria bacterium]|nr:HEAT repeat domain-containing protein [Deltaproteobacteria bacterium]
MRPALLGLLLLLAACGKGDLGQPDDSAARPPDAQAAADSGEKGRPEAGPVEKGPHHDEIVTLIKGLVDRHACNRITGCPGIVALAQYGSEIVAPSAELLRPGRPDGHWSTALIELLGQTDDAGAVVPLMALVHETKWETRIAAARALARLGPRVPGDRRAELARLAATAAADPKGPDLAFVASLELAQSMTAPTPEEAALHRDKLRAMVPATAELARETPPPILDVMVALVGDARMSEALPAVRGGLATGNRFVVATALMVAARLKDTGAIPYLLPLLDDRNPTLRREAGRALVAITGADLDGPEAWRDWASRHGIAPLPTAPPTPSPGTPPTP